MSRGAIPRRWILSGSVNILLCLGWECTADETSMRARLLGTPLDTRLEVELENGQKWSGSLIDVNESDVLLLCEPDDEMRKRFRLGSGMKLKKALRYQDIAAVDGAVRAEEVGRYLVLQIEEAPRMEMQLRTAALAGYRILASAGRRNVILENVDSSAALAFVVPDDVGEKREEEMDEWGADGFRVHPRTLGTSFGRSSAILERGPDDATPRDYRILQATREERLEEELLDAVRSGFRLVGLTTPGPTIVLLESGSPPEDVPEYTLLRDVDSNGLNEAASAGKRLVACSDGERLCVLESTNDELREARYEFLTAMRISALEEELNDAGRRGYRFHPRSFGVLDAALSERFAIVETTDAAFLFEYRIVSAKRGTEIEEKVNLAAREGFRVVAATAERKTMSRETVGAVLGGVGILVVDSSLPGQATNMLFKTLDTVLVVMERSTDALSQ